jgi:GNAT superfamily N-acetyltransferase
MLTIEPAVATDLPLVQQLILELAEYERLAHEAVATREDLAAALFDNTPRVYCDIARWQGEPAGMAIWFYNFSTFRGRHGLYLEDLFVKSNMRGKGVGAALLRQLAARCVRENLGRFEWSVLDWNEPAIGFYRSLGARPMQDWTVWRMDGAALERLGGARPQKR